MSFNGAGTFDRVHSWTTDKANSVKITASRMDAEDDGFATGLSLTICRDGQSTIIANIPFNDKKITGLGDATAATDAMNRQASDARYPQKATTNVFTANQTIESTDAGAGAEPALTLLRSSASPAADDAMGQLRFVGKDSADNDTVYAAVRSKLIDPTDTSEDGNLELWTSQAGTAALRVSIGGGLFTTGVTGGDKGAGTVNATALYEAGTALSSKYTAKGSTETITGAWTFSSANNLNYGTFSGTGATNGKVFVSSTAALSSSRDVTASASHLGFYNPNGLVGSINTSGSATAYNTSSDARRKTVIEYTLSPSSLIDQIAPLLARYTWKRTDEESYGPTAQDLNAVAPFAVTPGGDDPDTDPWGVDASKLIWHLIGYAKSLEQRISALEAAQ